jgi:cyclopropane fatty-acyl-phospholipid synthase-like methyltransferase
MDMQDMIRIWTQWGEEDPLFAILTRPDKRGNLWSEEEFFDTGAEAVTEDLAWLREAGIDLRLGVALDFGCGVGRLTHALASHFREVHGVDISPSMIRQARRLHERWGEAIRFFLLDKPDLSQVLSDRYDYICSHITLQHIPTRFQRTYLADFCDLLVPGGVALFQVVRTHGWRSLFPDGLVEAYRRVKYRDRPFFPMYGISRKTIAAITERAGCTVARFTSSPARDCPGRFRVEKYAVVKTPSREADSDGGRRRRAAPRVSLGDGG